MGVDGHTEARHQSRSSRFARSLTPSHAPPATLILSSPPSLYRAASSAISCKSWNRRSGPIVGS